MIRWSEEAARDYRPLAERIRALRAAIPQVGPDAPSHAEMQRVAKRMQAVGVEETKMELMVERMRVDYEVEMYEEQRQSLTSHLDNDLECPTCRGPMAYSSSPSLGRFLCCGKQLCRNCAVFKKSQLEECPMCHTPFPKDAQADLAFTKERAKSGCKWAQHALAALFQDGDGDRVAADKELAIKWHRCAAEQGCPESMYSLCHLLGDNQTSTRTEYRRWLQATLENGLKEHSIRVMEYLGIMKWEGWGGPEDKVDAGRLFTLSYAYSGGTPKTPLHLGFLHQGLADGIVVGDFEKNPYVAHHYLEQVATLEGNKEYVAAGQYFFAYAENALCHKIYCGKIDVPGHSSIPLFLHWLRKSKENGYCDAAGTLEEIEAQAKTFCANCSKKASEIPKKLKGCSQCCAVWYCDRDCQKMHWKHGHKVDCHRVVDLK